MADEMKECNTGITDATNDIIDSVKVLTKKMDDADAKQKILEAGKGIMKFMVRLLQLNDLYEITLILKQVRSESNCLLCDSHHINPANSLFRFNSSVRS
jgi:hypothetical protein